MELTTFPSADLSGTWELTNPLGTQLARFLDHRTQGDKVCPLIGSLGQQAGQHCVTVHILFSLMARPRIERFSSAERTSAALTWLHSRSRSSARAGTWSGSTASR